MNVNIFYSYCKGYVRTCVSTAVTFIDLQIRAVSKTTLFSNDACITWAVKHADN